MSEFLNKLSEHDIYIAAGARRLYVKVITGQQSERVANSSGEIFELSFAEDELHITLKE